MLKLPGCVQVRDEGYGVVVLRLEQIIRFDTGKSRNKILEDSNRTYLCEKVDFREFAS